MERSKRKLILGVSKYLRDNNTPYMNVGENIMILVANKVYHYSIIKFFDMPDDWEEKAKPFKIKYVKTGELSQIVKRIENYLKH